MSIKTYPDAASEPITNILNLMEKSTDKSVNDFYAKLLRMALDENSPPEKEAESPKSECSAIQNQSGLIGVQNQPGWTYSGSASTGLCGTTCPSGATGATAYVQPSYQIGESIQICPPGYTSHSNNKPNNIHTRFDTSKSVELYDVDVLSLDHAIRAVVKKQEAISSAYISHKESSINVRETLYNITSKNLCSFDRGQYRFFDVKKALLDLGEGEHLVLVYVNRHYIDTHVVRRGPFYVMVSVKY